MKQTIISFWQENGTFVNDNSKSNYPAANKITYNTKILKSNLCDINDAHILVTSDITVIAAPQTHIALSELCTIY